LAAKLRDNTVVVVVAGGGYSKATTELPVARCYFAAAAGSTVPQEEASWKLPHFVAATYGDSGVSSAAIAVAVLVPWRRLVGLLLLAHCGEQSGK